MKPIRLIAKLLQNSTKQGDIVVDWCGGSGSTLIVCEQIQRKCRIMEIDPTYCSTILHRYWKATGVEPKKAE